MRWKEEKGHHRTVPYIFLYYICHTNRGRWSKICIFETIGGRDARRTPTSPVTDLTHRMFSSSLLRSWELNSSRLSYKFNRKYWKLKGTIQNCENLRLLPYNKWLSTIMMMIMSLYRTGENCTSTRQKWCRNSRAFRVKTDVNLHFFLVEPWRKKSLIIPQNRAFWY